MPTKTTNPKKDPTAKPPKAKAKVEGLDVDRIHENILDCMVNMRRIDGKIQSIHQRRSTVMAELHAYQNVLQQHGLDAYHPSESEIVQHDDMSDDIKADGMAGEGVY